MSFVLGLTGGIAAGKTTTAKIFQEFGAMIIDADQVARQIVVPQTPGWRQIKAQFGEAFILPNQQLDRKKLGQLVFADRRQLVRLEQITGPLIRKEIQQQLQELKKQRPRLIILMVPLLFEGGYQSYCDQTMTISLSEQLQVKRLMERNHLSKESAENRLAAQMSTEKRDQLADFVIDNSQGFAHLRSQVIKWLQEKQFV
ncbi:dephospho-CoA kinase [Liquorilactobacillus sicerae]|uniref:dephospho-CoA kinase n=1 Tax=Liquorilactobacillus sicerae TaxID=1416943 RepID=UPI002480D1F4|nr:dephospho-CoA kinase [Liquorilactobacillus sicerae]